MPVGSKRDERALGRRFRNSRIDCLDPASARRPHHGRRDPEVLPQRHRARRVPGRDFTASSSAPRIEAFSRMGNTFPPAGTRRRGGECHRVQKMRRRKILHAGAPTNLPHPLGRPHRFPLDVFQTSHQIMTELQKKFQALVKSSMAEDGWSPEAIKAYLQAQTDHGMLTDWVPSWRVRSALRTWNYDRPRTKRNSSL